MNQSIRISMFLLIGFFSCLEAAALDTDSNNVVIVLDASGSMSERMSRAGMTKMEAAKTALISVLKQVPAGTNVGLLVFSAGNLKNDWAYPLGRLNPDRLEQAVRLPQPGGNTPLGAYIQKGADRLLEQRAKQFGYGTYRLLIVTDGEAQDQNLVDRYAPEVMARGITMDVIGVDMRKAHTLATRAHSYRSADDPEALTRALSDVFAEVGGVDQAGTDEEAFAQLSPIPDEMAVAMLKALAVSGNQPIGKGNPPQGMEKPLLDTAKQSASPSAPPPPPQESLPFWYWAVPAVIAIVWLSRRKRGKKRSRKY